MKCFRLAIIVMVGLLVTKSVFAQGKDRVKILQDVEEFSSNILFSFLDRADMQDPNKRAEFFLNVSEDELYKVAKANGMMPEKQQVVIFVDAAVGNFRTDTQSDRGKESMFYYKKRQEGCMVNWTAGDFTCMNMEKVGDYTKQAQEALKNMGNIEQMLQSIPDPKMREEALKKYKEAQQGKMTYPTPGMAAKSNIVIKRTGKTRGDEYQIRFTDGDEQGVAWVSRKHKDLAKIAQVISEDMQKAFGGMGGDDIRSQIKDGFPTEIRTFSQSMTSANLRIEKVKEIAGFSGDPFTFNRSELKEKDPMSMGRSKTRRY